MKAEKHIVGIYLSLCSRFPSFRKRTRKWLYEIMARFLQQDVWVFMNYGYACDEHEMPPFLEPEDEVNRLSYQLYHHLARKVPLNGKSVLEVGSGRGGGAALLMKYMRPKRMIGIDYSQEAVRLCKKRHAAHGLDFIQGDAEHLPLPDESCDVVINVESSHCYGSIPCFLAEVSRVLKPGGHFLLTDIRLKDELPNLKQQISACSLSLLEEMDITNHVVRALDADHDKRMNAIQEHVPKAFLGPFMEFAGVQGSTVLENLRTGTSVYVSFFMHKSATENTGG